jgi:hypothetical protein
MAAAARALARAAPSDHLKRVLGRYAFVHLHDVDRFARVWRNQLLKDPATKLTAEAAMPALTRLGTDWTTYREVRHYLAAKRQPRDDADPAIDQLSSFELWADIGLLSVETLVDDAIELYYQLAAMAALPPIEPEPEPFVSVLAALAAFHPVGEEAFLEVNASTFAAARPNTASIRMGGAIGRLIPLINDVAESAALMSALARAPDLGGPIERLVTCALPSEIHELLRLTIGPPDSVQQHSPDTSSLLALYAASPRPPDALTVLRHLDSTFPQDTQESLLDWRNRLGAHTDDETPWSELEAGIEATDLANYTRMFDHIELNLEHAACTAGGPVLMMLGARRLKSLFPLEGYAKHLAYDDTDASSEPGELRSSLPPAYADSEHVIWVNGPEGSHLTAAVAGMIAGRSRDVTERLEALREQHGKKGKKR